MTESPDAGSALDSVVVAAAPTIDGERFDPAAMTRAVNELLALGAEGVVASLRAYAEDAPPGVTSTGDFGSQRVLLLCRLLFVPEPGAFLPPLAIGVPDP